MLDALARRLFPNIAVIRESARQLQDTIARQNETINLLHEKRDAPPAAKRPGDWQLQDEMREAVMLAGAGPSLSAPTESTIAVKERFWDLELALEDRGWSQEIAIASTEFSRYGLQKLILMCRLYYIKNPLIKRGVEISGHYVFGRGVEVRSEDDAADAVIQDFLKRNEKELNQVGLVQKEQTLLTDGNLFFVFFRGIADGDVLIRTIDATEICEIITDPDDASQPWYYHRRWVARGFNPETGVTQNQTREAYYPCVDYLPAVRPANIAGKPILWESPVMHEKIGGLAKWLFGAPYVYAALDWARAVKNFLENWATIAAALARFTWQYQTSGGVQAIQAFQQTLQTTLANGGTMIETNPPPLTGAAFASGPNDKLSPIKTAGMQTDAEQCRRLVLMVAAAFGLPETFFGDASTGSLATAISLDRPTELKFMDRQEAWKACLTRICSYVLAQSNTAPGGRLREAREKMNPPKNGDLSDVVIEVAFPSVLEHDLAQTISAIVQGASLGGFEPSTMDIKTVAKLIMRELAVENPDEVADAIWPEDGYDPSKNMGLPEPPPAEIDPTTGMPKPQPGARTIAPSFGSEAARDQRLLMAIENLRRASERMLKERGE